MCQEPGCKGVTSVICQTGSTIAGYACDKCGRIHNADENPVSNAHGDRAFWDASEKRVNYRPAIPKVPDDEAAELILSDRR